MKRIILILASIIVFFSAVLEAGDERDLFRKGSNFANKGDYDRALECFNEAIQINPEYIAAYLAMAIVCVNKKIYYKAIESLNNIIYLNKKNANAYYILAMVYEEVNDTFGAIDAWNNYLELNPKGGRSNIAREHLRRLEGK